MIKIIEKLLDLIYICPCCFCHSIKEDKIICSKCYRKIRFMPSGVFKCENGCNIYACTIYDEMMKKLIKDLKYHNKKFLAEAQAQIMYDYWKHLNMEGDFIILPVPIHKNRKKERKYNHMDIVADKFAQKSGFKVNKNLLIRVKDTVKQFKLHKSERIENIRGAFEINPKEICDKNSKFLILDDITSTGITIVEIIKTLQSAGYNNLTALALSTPDIWN